MAKRTPCCGGMGEPSDCSFLIASFAIERELGPPTCLQVGEPGSGCHDEAALYLFSAANVLIARHCPIKASSCHHGMITPSLSNGVEENPSSSAKER